MWDGYRYAHVQPYRHQGITVLLEETQAEPWQANRPQPTANPLLRPMRARTFGRQTFGLWVSACLGELRVFGSTGLGVVPTPTRAETNTVLP